MIIYKATNLINGKVYIGQTVNTLEYRKSQHWREANDPKKKRHGRFHNALLKYGLENFKFEVIDTARSLQALNFKERYWIARYYSWRRDRGYNVDYGGKNSLKSPETKRLIGLSTKEKMKNPEIKARMIEGLRKGTEVWQQICADKRIKMVCPVCGKEWYLAPHEAKIRIYCSHKCASIGTLDKVRESSKKGLEAKHKLYETKAALVKADVLDWAISNRDYVKKIPLNKATNALAPISKIIYEKYGTKDIRSVSRMCGCMYIKDFVKYLKAYVDENIC